jgi:hypothetical protein
MAEKIPYPGQKEKGPAHPEGYRGLSPQVSEEELNNLIETGRMTLVNLGGAEVVEGDVLSINDRVYAKAVSVENEGINQKIELELLGN